MRKLFFLLLPIFCFTSGYGQTDTTIFTIVFSGNPKGFSKEWKNPDGSWGSVYQFNDRGRGDSMVTRWTEDGDGFPLSMTTTGKDYMKNVVEEKFSLSNGTAKWKNKSEDMTVPVSGRKFYIGLNGSAGHMDRALRSNGNTLSLLPFGQLNRENISEHNISGKKLSFVRYNGFGMAPGYGWLDEKGESFANVSDWSSTIRKGYESFVPALLEIQKKEESQYYSGLSAKLKMPSDHILIRNAALFDAQKAVLIPGMDILVENGKISAVGKTGSLRTNGRVIDAKGMTALPGLWDMHVHFSDDLDGILHVAAGVTHVRDMGNDSSLLKRISQIEKGNIIGPAVEIRSGFIDGAGPYAAPTGALINNLDEGLQAVRKYAAMGYQQIKLYSSIKPEWVKPLADEAHKYNMRVCGHIPAFMTATQAINAGYNEVTHMNMLALNFFGDTVDTRSPYRFSLPAQKTASLNLDGPEMQNFITLLQTKNVAVDPTIGVFEELFLNRDGVIGTRYAGIVGRFPIMMQRRLKAGGGGIPVPEGMDDTYKKSFAAFEKILKKLYDNHITIVAGTDGFAGFDLHRELELYVQSGIPAANVLQIATYNTAKYTGKDGSLGSIQPGKNADIILVEGNPVENISAIRNTRYIISGKTLYEADKLYRAVSIKP